MGGEIFQDYKVAWYEKTYTVPADKLLRVIAGVEDVVTFGELFEFSRRGVTPYGKLARAYGIVLRHAGLEIADDEVYSGMFAGNKSVEAVDEAIKGLYGLMIPDSLKDKGGEPASGNSRQSARKLSKRSTKRSSVKAG